MNHDSIVAAMRGPITAARPETVGELWVAQRISYSTLVNTRLRLGKSFWSSCEEKSLFGQIDMRRARNTLVWDTY